MTIRRGVGTCSVFVTAFALVTRIAAAQAASDSTVPPAFEDNSFIVEEAYNQEEGVVQHISGLTIDSKSAAYEYDFTQEWPVGSISHQLSYTLPFVHPDDPRGKTKLGDVMLNYRYQLVGDGDAKLAVSPRLSALFPTGDWKTGTGTGATGLELFVPASVVISDLLVTHLNAGVRYTPRARNTAGDRANISKYTAGGSVIVRPWPYFHFLVEGLWARQQEVVASGKTGASSSVTILPGARAAFNFSSGLQVVPGVGFPFGIGPSKGDRGVFLYLSFEHPFSAAGRSK